MSIACETFVQNAWKKDLCSNCFKSVSDHAGLCVDQQNYAENKNTSYISNSLLTYRSANSPRIKDRILIETSKNSQNQNNSQLKLNIFGSDVRNTQNKFHKEITRRFANNEVIVNKSESVEASSSFLRILKDEERHKKKETRKTTVTFAEGPIEIIGYGGSEFDSDEDWDLETCVSDIDLESLDVTEEDKLTTKLTKENTEFNSNQINLSSNSTRKEVLLFKQESLKAIFHYRDNTENKHNKTEEGSSTNFNSNVYQNQHIEKCQRSSLDSHSQRRREPLPRASVKPFIKQATCSSEHGINPTEKLNKTEITVTTSDDKSTEKSLACISNKSSDSIYRHDRLLETKSNELPHASDTFLESPPTCHEVFSFDFEQPQSLPIINYKELSAHNYNQTPSSLENINSQNPTFSYSSIPTSEAVMIERCQNKSCNFVQSEAQVSPKEVPRMSFLHGIGKKLSKDLYSNEMSLRYSEDKRSDTECPKNGQQCVKGALLDVSETSQVYSRENLTSVSKAKNICRKKSTTSPARDVSIKVQGNVHSGVSNTSGFNSTDSGLSDSSSNPDTGKKSDRREKLAALAIELEKVRSEHTTKRRAPIPPKTPGICFDSEITATRESNIKLEVEIRTQLPDYRNNSSPHSYLKRDGNYSENRKLDSKEFVESQTLSKPVGNQWQRRNSTGSEDSTCTKVKKSKFSLKRFIKRASDSKLIKVTPTKNATLSPRVETLQDNDRFDDNLTYKLFENNQVTSHSVYDSSGAWEKKNQSSSQTTGNKKEEGDQQKKQVLDNQRDARKETENIKQDEVTNTVMQGFEENEATFSSLPFIPLTSSIPEENEASTRPPRPPRPFVIPRKSINSTGQQMSTKPQPPTVKTREKASKGKSTFKSNQEKPQPSLRYSHSSVQSDYANLGDVRSNLAPKKPERTSIFTNTEENVQREQLNTQEEDDLGEELGNNNKNEQPSSELREDLNNQFPQIQTSFQLPKNHLVRTVGHPPGETYRKVMLLLQLPVRKHW
ncbi:uncharacterized protein LOC143225054 [Tachypleus tridentatus]|uniref:uncharacterized protein LOC143225054 n=1 Tax=Tachypleus tridentatus TaxID=6853 RepID=UPI003FCF28A0